MKRARRLTPSPAMGVAILALFLTLTGTVVAATKLAKNSVGTQQIKNGSIKGGDLAEDTLTGEQVKENTLGVVPRAATAGTATAAATAGVAQSAKVAERATSADRAASAATADRAASAATADRAASSADADRVGGHAADDFASSQELFTVAVKMAANDTPTTLVERDGVKLYARCTPLIPTASGLTATVLSIYAESSAPGATLSSPKSMLDGSSGSTLDPATAENDRLAVQQQAITNTRAARFPPAGIVLTSAAGTTIFFGGTVGIRVSFGLQGAACAVTAPVMISTL